MENFLRVPRKKTHNRFAQTCQARKEFGSVSTIFPPPYNDTRVIGKEKKFKAEISGKYRPTTRLLEF